jgi:hypothetical protein
MRGVFGHFKHNESTFRNLGQLWVAADAAVGLGVPVAASGGGDVEMS